MLRSYVCYQYYKHNSKTNIAVFYFPNKDKRPEVYKAWYNEIYKYRRKGAKTSFKLLSIRKFVNLISSQGISRGIKTLKTGQEIPSVFTFKET